MALEVGFIGVGGVAQPHLNNLNAMRGVHLRAVCDVNEERMSTAAEKFGAAPYSDYRRMLDQEKLDAVYVCLIPAAHKNIELDLVERGLPFFLEKPIHISLATARKVAAGVEAKGLITCVGYHFRYTAAVQAAKKFLAGRKISLAQGWWYGGMPGVAWWRVKSLSGGQIVEQTTHIFDVARYLVGDVTKVYAAGATGAMTDVENYDVEDASHVVLHFDNGAVGNIISGCIANGTGKSRVGLQVDGRGWTVEVTAGRCDITHKGKPIAVDTKQDWMQQLGNGDKAFIKAVQTGDASGILSTYADGLKTLAVTLAANESLKTGKPAPVKM